MDSEIPLHSVRNDNNVSRTRMVVHDGRPYEQSCNLNDAVYLSCDRFVNAVIVLSASSPVSIQTHATHARSCVRKISKQNKKFAKNAINARTLREQKTLRKIFHATNASASQ